MSTFQTKLIAALFTVSFLLISDKPAQAMDRNVKTVITTGLYGAAAGALIGAIAWPITDEPRALFIGAATGLYLGVGVGIFHILFRDDPQNPLSPNSPYSVLPPAESVRSPMPLAVRESARQIYAVEVVRYPVLRF